jgi:peptidase E
MRRIVTIGGGGFLMEEAPSLLDDYLVGLLAAGRKRICFVPTASGDAEAQLDKFYRAFERYDAELSHLAFFRKPRLGALAFDEIELRLPEQDLIYVGGGNTRSMLAVWREWGLPQTLRKALERGTMLAGVSAGAICWFEFGASDSLAPGARSDALRCLGFLKGSCAPHWGAEAHRRRDFHALIRAGKLPAGYGIGDGVALRFDEGRLAEVVAIDGNRPACRVESIGDRLCETPIAPRILPAASSVQAPVGRRLPRRP